jgi:hypothetical protein
MNTRAREQAATHYEKAAQELEQAALHLRTAARYMRKGEVLCCGAHEWAAHNHSLNASYLLDMLSHFDTDAAAYEDDDQPLTHQPPRLDGTGNPANPHEPGATLNVRHGDSLFADL